MILISRMQGAASPSMTHAVTMLYSYGTQTHQLTTGCLGRYGEAPTSSSSSSQEVCIGLQATGRNTSPRRKQHVSRPQF